jgi:predicted alpha-1,6-mannanase (GH76 family)
MARTLRNPLTQTAEQTGRAGRARIRVNQIDAASCMAGIAVVWLAICGLGTPAKAFTLEDARTLLQAHTQAFYQATNGNACFKKNTSGGKADFWKRAEMMEMELDAYERAPNPRQLAIFTNLFHGFVADYGENWAKNEFNDDIMWMVIACARGYLLSGNPAFREAARRNFDACYARAWSSDLGGGLWWKTDNKSKNACVNGPAAIAAALLSRACQEPAYLTKATNIFLWERATLFDPETGRVSDNIRTNGHKSTMSFSYNQGTFVGAANLLGFTNEAMLAATYTMNQLCRDGLLPSYGENGDSGGFNGICVRWIARFMNERGAQQTFEPWLQKNADAAWNVHRTSDNISWCRWHDPTPPGERDAWGCSSSVVILQVVRPTDVLNKGAGR